MVGGRLGPYEIVDKLGEGGMGEVYLARDARLGREVAVKVLPAEFAGDPDRLDRFEREARAAAALNHPHIAAVFDIGAEDGTHYIVQERLEGSTLRERLDRGRLPLGTALELSTEIAEALAAAHAAGIVHRDLKPENVFVSEDGHAKVLDFGLAKLTEPARPRDGSATQSPTVLGTSAGQIMGTAGYMAPEQVTGEDVDARADVFAFGCLLYELAGGERAFEGKNLPEVLHRLSNEEPRSLEKAAPGLPPELSRIVRKCLAKEPARRYQGAADLAVDLRALVAEVEAGRAPATATAATSKRAGAGPAVIAAAAAAGLGLGAILYATLQARGPSPAGDVGPIHLSLSSVEGLDSENWTQMALSPDGRNSRSRWVGAPCASATCRPAASASSRGPTVPAPRSSPPTVAGWASSAPTAACIGCRSREGGRSPSPTASAWPWDRRPGSSPARSCSSPISPSR